jgi:hypothetical protein
VAEYGAAPYLVSLLMSPSADVREQCAWCLGNIAGDCTELRDLVLELKVRALAARGGGPGPNAGG